MAKGDTYHLSINQAEENKGLSEKLIKEKEEQKKKDKKKIKKR